VSARDVDARVDLSLGALPVSSGGYYSLLVRRTTTTNYGVRVRATSTYVALQLFRTVSGAATVIAAQTISGYLFAAGDLMHLRLQTVGTGTTTLRAMFWVNNQPMPAAWTIQASDTTAAHQGPGGVGVHAYVSSSSTGSVMLTVDNLAVTPP